MTTVPARPSATDRLIAKLNDPNATFSRSQVAYLMGASGQWARDVVDGEPSPLSFRAGWEAGYRARVAEENAAYPPEPMSVLPPQRETTIAVYRGRAGVDVVGPREGDFQGLGDEAVERLRAETEARALPTERNQ